LNDVNTYGFQHVRGQPKGSKLHSANIVEAFQLFAVPSERLRGKWEGKKTNQIELQNILNELPI